MLDATFTLRWGNANIVPANDPNDRFELLWRIICFETLGSYERTTMFQLPKYIPVSTCKHSPLKKITKITANQLWHRAFLCELTHGKTIPPTNSGIELLDVAEVPRPCKTARQLNPAWSHRPGKHDCRINDVTSSQAMSRGDAYRALDRARQQDNPAWSHRPGKHGCRISDVTSSQADGGFGQGIRTADTDGVYGRRTPTRTADTDDGYGRRMRTTDADGGNGRPILATDTDGGYGRLIQPADISTDAVTPHMHVN